MTQSKSDKEQMLSFKDLTFSDFQNSFLEILNHNRLMIKSLRKAIMARSRLKSRFNETISEIIGVNIKAR